MKDKRKKLRRAADIDFDVIDRNYAAGSYSLEELLNELDAWWSEHIRRPGRQVFRRASDSTKEAVVLTLSYRVLK